MQALEQAYILHRYPFKDYDWMLKLWLKDQGPKTAVMRGARRPKSQYRAVSQPFMPLQISLKGRGDVLSVVSCEPDGAMSLLHGQSQAIAFYLNELLLTFLPKDEALPGLFELYDALLQRLAVLSLRGSDSDRGNLDRDPPVKPEDDVFKKGRTQGSAPTQPFSLARDLEVGNSLLPSPLVGEGLGVRGEFETQLREFEFALFDALGIGMHFSVDQQHQPIKPDQDYLIQAGALPLLIQADRAMPRNALTINGKLLLNIEARDWNTESLKAAKHICRRWVDHYSHGKVFKSRELFVSSL